MDKVKALTKGLKKFGVTDEEAIKSFVSYIENAMNEDDEVEKVEPEVEESNEPEVEEKETEKVEVDEPIEEEPKVEEEKQTEIEEVRQNDSDLLAKKFEELENNYKKLSEDFQTLSQKQNQTNDLIKKVAEPIESDAEEEYDYNKFGGLAPTRKGSDITDDNSELIQKLGGN